jgi:hypothetical protein
MADPLAGYHPRAVLLVAAFGRPLRRASLVGAVAGIVAGAAAMYGLESSPWLIAAALAIAATVGIGFAVTLVLLPTGVRRAFDAFSWLGAREVDRFRERTGSTTPRSSTDVMAWLDANPVGPITREARVEMLLSIGRISEGRAELAALGPGTTDLARLERAGLRAYAEIVETGAYDEASFDTILTTIPSGTDLALEAAASRAVMVTRVRLAHGDPDPLEPLLVLRPMLGRDATAVTLRRTWLPFLRSLTLFGVAIALFGYVLRGGLFGLG